MKKLLIAVICLLSINHYAQPVRIHAQYGKDDKVTYMIVDNMGALLEFGCRLFTDSQVMSAAVRNERDRALLYSGDIENFDSRLADLAKAMGARYLLNAKERITNDQIYVTLEFIDVRKTNVLVRKMYTIKDLAEASSLKGKEIAKDFIEEISYLEICPYKGPVSVKIYENKNEKAEDKHAVFCGGEMKEFSRITKTYSRDNTRWNLNKIGHESTNGTFNWELFTETVETENNECYPCTSGKIEKRISNKTTTVKADISDLSNKSNKYEHEAKDARVKIKFEKGGTYQLYLRASSEKGAQTTIIKENITGHCDTKEINETHPSQRNVPLDLVLGPFKGSPMDKKLHAKGSKILSESSNGKSYYEYDFTLSRE